jgi:hypothetical protein
MKKLLWVAAVILVVLLGIYLLRPPANSVVPAPAPVTASVPADQTGSNTSTGNSSTAAVVPGTGNSPSADLSSQAGSPAAVTVDTNAVLSPAAVLESMRRVIHGYNTEFGENPVGNNAEITRALMGENPRHINFIQPDTGLQVNANGELVDAWGTPFFFHQLSGQDMEIHSAGPDRIMWTSDDLIGP